MSRAEIIGKATSYDIFNENGILLLPRYSKLNQDKIDWLEQHKIFLTVDDVINFDTPYYHKVVDEAVSGSKKVFDEVRRSLKLPMEYVEKNIVSSVTNIASGAHVIDLFMSLQAKDDYTYRHNIAVGALASLVGKWLNLTDDEILHLSMAGFLHDVGKMKVPEEILNKPGPLTDKEFSIMKQHTVYGYEIIKNTVGTTHRQALAALQHHERMDGSGYPLGLTQQKIDLFGRIIGVVDVFHAMTSKRVYRDELPFYKVLYQMSRDSFGQLDPMITRLFIENMMLSLIGHNVLLTDQRQANIVMIHKNDPMNPLIKIDDHFIDLSKNRSLHIEKVIS